MKRIPSFSILGPLLALAACSTAPAPRAEKAPSPEPGATPAAPTDAGPSASESDERRKKVETMVRQLAGGGAQEERGGGEYPVVPHPKTGQPVNKVAKTTQYFAQRGRLYNVVLRDREGIPIVHEDAEAWYIDLPPKASAEAQQKAEAKEEEIGRKFIVDLPPGEEEVVEVPRSASKLRFEELSEGLPVSGMWRENFDLGDVQGDPRLELVVPPARLSGREIQIFALDGKKWTRKEPVFRDPEKVGFEYGGLTVADMDKDGRRDIVFVKHGTGPAIAFNEGGLKFRVETRGLVQLMSSRAVATGDLDADGRPDVVAISDEPEYLEVRRLEQEGNATARFPRSDGSVLGYDIRAFFARGNRYEERLDGLADSCFGYSLVVAAPAADGGRPFFANSCRYQGNPEVIHEYDPSQGRFVGYGKDFAEGYSVHLGSALGTYRGHPAVFMTYIKNGPQGAVRDITGNGVSIYYREDGSWKRKRLFKMVEPPSGSQGVAVGDLDGDGLDDVAYADDVRGRVRVFFQLPDGGFEELPAERQPTYVNHGTSVRIGDVDGDGRRDVVLMYQYLTGDRTRSGGLRVFRVVM